METRRITLEDLVRSYEKDDRLEIEAFRMQRVWEAFVTLCGGRDVGGESISLQDSLSMGAEIDANLECAVAMVDEYTVWAKSEVEDFNQKEKLRDMETPNDNRN